MLNFIYYPVSAIMWFWHKVFGAVPFLGPDNGIAWALAVVFLAIGYSVFRSNQHKFADLATDLGTTADNGLTWTFTLREGVRFENEQPITSRDVKYGIERSFASDVVVGGPTRVVELLDDPANPYAGPYQDESPGRLGLASIATPDDRTTDEEPTP